VANTASHKSDVDLNDLKRRMHGALETLHKELGGLRTGRASPSLLDPVHVNAYGSSMPLNQVGTVSVPEARMLTVQVWDRTLVNAVDKAIRDAGLGLNPITDGQTVRVPLPELTTQRRQEIATIADTYAEQARAAVRNVRRDGMDRLKRAEKDGTISQDEHHGKNAEVQKMTDGLIKQIDALRAQKEKEIMQV